MLGRWEVVSLLVSMLALHLLGRGFKSVCLCVCGVCVFSLCTLVFSGHSGFFQQYKDMCCKLAGSSQLSVVCVHLKPIIDWHPIQGVPFLVHQDSWNRFPVPRSTNPKWNKPCREQMRFEDYKKLNVKICKVSFNVSLYIRGDMTERTPVIIIDKNTT